MIVSLEEMKDFLRVDYDEDDSQIQHLIDAAESYISGAIDDYQSKLSDEKFKSKARLVTQALVTHWFDKRDFTASGDEKTRYTLRTLLSQMNYAHE